MTPVLDPEGAHLAALRRLGEFGGRRVLEMGCGDGRLTVGMTSRLPAEQADELEVARAEGISVSDAVREAIAEHIARKRKDEAFRARLRTVMERDREILERLGR